MRPNTLNLNGAEGLQWVAARNAAALFPCAEQRLCRAHSMYPFGAAHDATEQSTLRWGQ